MKRIAIVTDDTTIMLPEIDSWKGKIGRGTEITKNKSVHGLLNDASMNLPTTDVERESSYKEVLKDFIRPARLMYGGSFSEIRGFHSKLRETYPVDLYVISGRYGLTKGESEILPYFAPISDIDKVEDLELRHNISKSMLEVSSAVDFLILSLPSYFVKYLIQKSWFEKVSNQSKTIIVCASVFRKALQGFRGLVILDRVGVARLGKKNQHHIVDILNR